MDTPAKLMKWIVAQRGRKRPLAHPRGEPRVKSEERQYVRSMLPILNGLERSVRLHLLEKLPKIVASYGALRPNLRRDAVDDDVREAMKNIRIAIQEEFSAAEIKKIAEERGISVARLNQEFLDRGVKRVLDVDVFNQQPYLADQVALFAEQNAGLITSMESQFLDKVETMAFNGIADGLRADEIESKIMNLIDPSVGNIRARAELIARDQIGKLNGQLSELRQTEIGVQRYVWRTSGDERVRDSHAELDGEVFDWSDPPKTNSRGDRNHPGGDYQCRCWAEPVLSDLVEGVDAEQDDEIG